jgi:hypothetical protein
MYLMYEVEYGSLYGFEMYWLLSTRFCIQYYCELMLYMVRTVSNGGL